MSIQEFKNSRNSESFLREAPWGDYGFIFAVNTQGSSGQEMEYIEARLGEIARIKQVEGSWDGKRETSYVVFPIRGSESDLWMLKQQVLKLAILHKQQSILCLGPKREDGRCAKLLWMNIGTEQDIGHFVAVSPAEAMKSQGWTRDSSQFYIVK